ncbi:hypothetical protein EII17_03300 [Clostridiales bacterium COT073_COT-073]|nr:hypothetical protein EII17_03300 [Clostridiales bacterium COT073_COT-073]
MKQNPFDRKEKKAISLNVKSGKPATKAVDAGEATNCAAIRVRTVERNTKQPTIKDGQTKKPKQPIKWSVRSSALGLSVVAFARG